LFSVLLAAGLKVSGFIDLVGKQDHLILLCKTFSLLTSEVCGKVAGLTFFVCCCVKGWVLFLTVVPAACSFHALAGGLGP
jgi:hypothetical protein